MRGNLTSDEDFQDATVPAPIPGPVPAQAGDDDVQVVMHRSLPRNSKNNHKMAAEVRTPGQAIDVVCNLCPLVII